MSVLLLYLVMWNCWVKERQGTFQSHLILSAKIRSQCVVLICISHSCSWWICRSQPSSASWTGHSDLKEASVHVILGTGAHGLIRAKVTPKLHCCFVFLCWKADSVSTSPVTSQMNIDRTDLKCGRKKPTGFGRGLIQVQISQSSVMLSLCTTESSLPTSLDCQQDSIKYQVLPLPDLRCQAMGAQKFNFSLFIIRPQCQIQKWHKRKNESSEKSSEKHPQTSQGVIFHLQGTLEEPQCSPRAAHKAWRVRSPLAPPPWPVLVWTIPSGFKALPRERLASRKSQCPPRDHCTSLPSAGALKTETFLGRCTQNAVHVCRVPSILLFLSWTSYFNYCNQILSYTWITWG